MAYPTVYPGSIDSYTTKTDGVDDVMAVDVNELQSAIVAIETKLRTGTSVPLHALDSADHTTTGRTAGQIIIATAATTFGWSSGRIVFGGASSVLTLPNAAVTVAGGGASCVFTLPNAAVTIAGTGTFTLNGDSAMDGSLDDLALSQIHEAFCVGDSLTADGTYVSQLNSSLGATWYVVNMGIGGQTTAQIQARFSLDVLARGGAEYVVVLAGINDVVTDVAAGTIETNLQAMYTAAHNAGLSVVAVTITPFKGFASWSAGRQTVLDTVNTWIMNTATNVEYRVDAYTVLEDPGVADTLLAAYDSGDHLHLSTAGYQLLGTTVYGGATWTPKATDVATKFSGTSVSVDQDLRSDDSVVFRDIKASYSLSCWTFSVNGAALTVPTAGAAVVGSGTATYVTYFTAANTVAGSAFLTYDATNHILTVSTSTDTPGIIVSAVLTTNDASIKLATANRTGEADTGNASIQFYDNLTQSFQFLAALGNNPASSRYGGFVAYSDRDGTRLPLWFFTADTNGNVQVGLKLAAGQAAGTSGGTTVVGPFGCNNATPQTAYASGGALAAYVTGAFGLDSDAHMSALHAMVVKIRAALVANGIMS